MENQQPHWVAMEEGCTLLADNLSRYANIQPFNQAELLNEIRAIRTELCQYMAEFRTKLRADIAGIRGGIVAEYGICPERKCMEMLSLKGT